MSTQLADKQNNQCTSTNVCLSNNRVTAVSQTAMARKGTLPQREITGRMSALLLLLALSGVLNCASAARLLQQSVRISSTVPALAGQASTWAPPAQYSNQRITASSGAVSTAAVAPAAPAVLGVQMPSQLISGALPTAPTIPAIAKPPVVSSYGGPGAGFVTNMPVITAKPAGTVSAVPAPAMAAAAPQLPTNLPAPNTGSSSSNGNIDVASRARLAAGFGALSQLPSLPLPAATGAAALPGNIGSIANSLGGAVAAAAQGASNAASGANAAQFLQTAALSAQKFVQNDLPKLITAAAKDPNVQKGVQQLVSDLAAGKLPQLPENLGQVAKQLNLPDEVAKGLSNIKLPENLSDIKLPEVKLPEGLSELKIPSPGDLPRFELPKLDMSRFNIPGFGNGATGAQGLPQLPGLNSLGVRSASIDDQLAVTRWTNPPVPQVNQYGATGVTQLDTAKLMLGVSDYNPAQPPQPTDNHSTGARSKNTQQQKQQQQQRVTAMRARQANKPESVAAGAAVGVSAGTAKVQRRNNPAAAAAVNAAAAVANSTVTSSTVAVSDTATQTTTTTTNSSSSSSSTQTVAQPSNSSANSSISNAPAAALTSANPTAADSAKVTTDVSSSSSSSSSDVAEPAAAKPAAAAPAAATGADATPISTDVTSSNATTAAPAAVTMPVAADSTPNAAADSNAADNNSSSSSDDIPATAADAAPATAAAPPAKATAVQQTTTTSSSSSSLPTEQTAANSTTTPAETAAAAATTASSSSSSSPPVAVMTSRPMHRRSRLGAQRRVARLATAAAADPAAAGADGSVL